METLSHFRSIEELIKILDREKMLFQDMFERRKSATYRYDFALALVKHERDRIAYLIEHDVIHESGDFLELEDVYVRFFEEVLDVNEEINIASVKEQIDALKENIDYYRTENNENRRAQYQLTVRKQLRKIGLRTLKNIVDLMRNVDVAYKQEPNYAIKIARLSNLDEKRKNIGALMVECEKLMEKEVAFFAMASDPKMQRTCQDLRNDFTLAAHNLLEIERQIISYINRIEQQNLWYKKLRKLKYLKDHLTWREETDVAKVLSDKNALWMKPRHYHRVLLSLDQLRTDENAYTLIRKIGSKGKIRGAVRVPAPPLDKELLADNTATLPTVNITEMWNAFKAQGSHLFAFIINYNYSTKRTLNEHINLYCQMATMYSDRLRFTGDYDTIDNIEYALIYAN